MITSEIKSKVDKIGGDMWAGGIAGSGAKIKAMIYSYHKIEN